MLHDRELTRDDLPFPLNRPITGQDLLQLFPRLMRPMWRAAAHACRADVATVRTVHADPARVTVQFADGARARCRYTASYTPTVGDAVLVLRNRAKAVVIDRLA